MCSDPFLDGGTLPDASDCEFGLGLWEVVVSLDELVHALLRDAEDHGDLGDAHQIEDHQIRVRKDLTNIKAIG
jgi:hypothetical protein